MWDVKWGDTCGNTLWTSPELPEAEHQEVVAAQRPAEFKS